VRAKRHGLPSVIASSYAEWLAKRGRKLRYQNSACVQLVVQSKQTFSTFKVVVLFHCPFSLLLFVLFVAFFPSF